MRERIRAFLNTPIEGDVAQRRAMVVAVVVLVGAAVIFLTLGDGGGGGNGGGQRPKDTAQQDGSGGGAASAPAPTPEPIVGPTGDPIAGRPRPEIDQPARAFFASYVAAYYGQGSPRQIRAATPRLTARLARTRPNTALRGRRPKVVAVLADRDGAGYRVGARVDDGASTGPFPLEARFERVGPGGSWRAVELFTGD